MSPQILTSALGTLRNAGSVFGLLFTRGQEVIFQDTSFSDDRIREVALTVDDIAYYFEQEKRSPDQLAFGYDGGSLLILLHGEFRIVLFHHHIDEVDFVARAARAFLKDYEMGIVIDEWATTPVRASASGGTGRVSIVPVAPAR